MIDGDLVDLLPPILRNNRRVSEAMALANARPSMNQQPIYVKHGFPELFREKREYHDYLPTLPQLPGPEGAAEEEYGLMYYKPETEAELKMHDLWIAKRREEAFHWKAQQQLTLVLDRMALHRSAQESDLLRRHETAAYLRGANNTGKSPEKAKTPPAPMPPQTRRGSTMPVMARQSSLKDPGAADTAPSTAASAPGTAGGTAAGPKSPNRFAPIVDPNAGRRRVLSGRIGKRIHAGKYDFEEEEDETNIYDEDDDDDDEDDDEDGPAAYEEDNTLKGVSKVVIGTKTLVQSVRKDVKKKGKGAVRPFRFSSALPLSYKHEFYMELSDSDEDEEGAARTGGGPSRGGGRTPSRPDTEGGGERKAKAAKKPDNKKVPAGTVKVFFKHDKPENRERPISATLFRSLADADPELKVLYRHTNFRRMPLTMRQEKWLEDRHAQRMRTSMDYAKALAEAEAEKQQKKKDKESGKDGKGGKKDEKPDKKKEEKKAKEEAERAAKAKPPPPKYKSASQFMNIHFPHFDGDDEEDRVESCGPMKITQMAEVERVLDACAHANIQINESALKKGLLIPQDHPDAICQENLRDSSIEGLMVNPLPPELWRKGGGGGKKGKKGGGGKKKKG
jgi:hypothetical protein